jgi:predicted RNA polymerase sigma factor
MVLTECPLQRAMADSEEVALAAVDRLEDKLAGYHAYHATRADLLRRLGYIQKARAAYDKPSSWPATPPRPPT